MWIELYSVRRCWVLLLPNDAIRFDWAGILIYPIHLSQRKHISNLQQQTKSTENINCYSQQQQQQNCVKKFREHRTGQNLIAIEIERHKIG